MNRTRGLKQTVEMVGPDVIYEMEELMEGYEQRKINCHTVRKQRNGKFRIHTAGRWSRQFDLMEAVLVADRIF